MDIIGTASVAISLCCKIISIFEQVDHNRSASNILYGDIVEVLTRMQDFLSKNASCASKELCDDLSEFENELRGILSRQKGLTRRTTGGSMAKAREICNSGDIKNELADFRQRVEMCCQKLLVSCTVRVESTVTAIDEKVTAMNEQITALRDAQEATDQKLQILLDNFLPGSTPKRRATLDQIQQNIQEHIIIDTSDDIPNLPILAGGQVASSVKSAKSSVASLSESLINKQFLKGRVKDLSAALPQFRDQVLKKNISRWLSSFRGLAPWESTFPSSVSRESSIQEALRILTVLRSGDKISPKAAVRDLLRLARVLVVLGMGEEACEICEWGVQICQELAKSGDTRSLFDLSKLLYRLFVDLNSVGESAVSQAVQSQAIAVRHQLEEMGQKSYLLRLAFFMEKESLTQEGLGWMGVAVNAMEEVVEIRRYLITVDQEAHSPKLAWCLHKLAVQLGKSGRYEDAIGQGKEAAKICRKLVATTYLPLLGEILNLLAQYLNKAGRSKDAAKAAEECVEVHRELAGTNRNTYLPHLANSLHDLALYLNKSGRSKDAVNAGSEAVEIRRELVGNSRNTHLVDLASSLHKVSIYLRQSGQDSDALTAVNEAVEMRRELVGADRSTHLPYLADSLFNLATSLDKFGQYGDAQSARQEAHRIRW